VSSAGKLGAESVPALLANVSAERREKCRGPRQLGVQRAWRDLWISHT
jgi:hypothetical protein